MATVIRHQKFASVDLKGNSNKVWEGKVYDDGTFEASWGRIGGTMQSESKQMGSADAADRYMNKKIAEKTKPKTDKNSGMVTMYEEVNTVDTDGFQPPAKVEQRNLSEIAKSQVSYTNPVVAELIEKLARVNIHNIISATGGKMSYNDTTGLFSTPLGVVTQGVIDEARGLLTEIGDFVVAADYENDTFIDVAQKYMRRIPMDLGYKKIVAQNIFPDLGAVRKQNDVLDSLQASLQMALAPPDDGVKIVVEQPKIFDIQMELIEDGKEIDRLRKLYRETRREEHVCRHLDVKRAFVVDIRAMREAFEPVANKLGEVRFLWHGSRTWNLLSILKSGLSIPPENSSHCSGRMFGNGAYFAIHSTKSLNYSFGNWDGKQRDENCFMFLADVALGKFCVPRHSGSNYPLPGFDSTWAQPNVSGVRNDEIIVPNVNQCNLKYLLEFSPGGK